MEVRNRHADLKTRPFPETDFSFHCVAIVPLRRYDKMKLCSWSFFYRWKVEGKSVSDSFIKAVLSCSYMSSSEKVNLFNVWFNIVSRFDFKYSLKVLYLHIHTFALHIHTHISLYILKRNRFGLYTLIVFMYMYTLDLLFTKIELTFDKTFILKIKGLWSISSHRLKRETSG